MTISITPTAITKETRIQHLELLLNLATTYCNQNQVLIRNGSSKWIKEKAKNAVDSLQEIIARIYKDMEPDSLEAYCRQPPDMTGVPVGDTTDPAHMEKKLELSRYWSELTRQVQPAFAQIDIVRLAPENNIIHDITWLQEGVVGDYVEFALGRKQVTEFAEFLPGCIADVQIRLLPFYNSLTGYEEKTNLIRKAISHSRDNDFLSSNILLITVTESIVWDLCKHVYKHQHPDATAADCYNFFHTQFHSLQKLILQGGWKDDFPIKINEAVVTYFDVYEPAINRHRAKVNAHKKAYWSLMDLLYEEEKILRPSNGDITEEQRLTMLDHLNRREEIQKAWIGPGEDTVCINLSTMLNFLARKYKDDRNALIHGDFGKLNQKWVNYINFAALTEVSEVYIKYLKVYPLVSEPARAVES